MSVQATTPAATEPGAPDASEHREGRLALGRPLAEGLGIGAVILGWSDRGLRSLRFEAPRRGPRPARDAGWSVVPFELAEPILAALDGDGDVDLAGEVPVDLQGTAFQRRVWDALATIPRGRVRSYGEVARQVGAPRATRAVGQAVGRNPVPLVIPCHRVVHADRRLGGYSGGGPDRKRRLLLLEGVSVAGGRVVPGQLPLALVRRDG